jgi:isopenicillin-N epimerase
LPMSERASGIDGGPCLPAGSEHARHWRLDPGVVFLNHGSFGACPAAVLEEQARLRGLMEAEPVAFFVERMGPLLDEARVALAAFVRCRGEDLVFVPNATTAVATVIEHLAGAGGEGGEGAWLRPGDEVLATAHEYPACMNNLRRAAARAGARVVSVPIPFPLSDPGEAAEAVLGAVTGRTRVALISHVTSPSALILPLERIVPELERRGVVVIVDGAHAPGFTAVNVAGLGCSFYTANCHKWMCTPKGSAFLYIREDRQRGLRPLVLSNNAETPRPGRKHLLTEFDFTGTADYSAWLSIPAAIRFLGGVATGGWPGLMERNHAVLMRAKGHIEGMLGVGAAAPESMLGSMATIFLPPHEPERQARLSARPSRYHDALQDALLERHRIQVPIWAVPGEVRRFIRISVQLYNAPGQYEYLAGALGEELERERRG